MKNITKALTIGLIGIEMLFSATGYAQADKVDADVKSDVIDVKIAGHDTDKESSVSAVVLKNGISWEMYKAATGKDKFSMIEYSTEINTDALGDWNLNFALNGTEKSRHIIIIYESGSEQRSALQIMGRYEIVDLINKADKEQVKEILNNYSKYLNLESNPLYDTLYKNSSDNIKGYLYAGMGNKSNYTSVEQIEGDVFEFTALGYISKAEGYDQIYDNLKDIFAVIGYDSHKYDELSNEKKYAVCRGLGDTFQNKTFDKGNLIAELNKLINEQSKTSGGGSGSSGGSGNSGGFGGSGASKVTFDAEEGAIANDSAFDDIDSVPWAKDAIEYLSKCGIINGKSARRFYPNDNITREEFVKIAVCAFEINEEDDKELLFKDVSKGDWYYPFVLKGVNSGLINGMSVDEFGVGIEITRQDMAKIIYSAVKDKISEERESAFGDFDTVSDYAKIAVASLNRAEIINGYDDMLFMPSNNATRAEAAKMIYSALMKLK